MSPTTTTKRGVNGWIVGHPMTAFVTLAYLLSWTYWIPLALGSRTAEQGVAWPSQMPGLLGPAVAAAIVTAVVSGRKGLHDLWRRITRWRVGRWWWSVPAILAAGMAGLVMAGSAWNTDDLSRYNGVSATIGPAMTVLVVLVVNGFGEETGWRGFLADRLLRRHSLTTTALIVTAVWAPWHAPMFFFLSSFEDFSPAMVVGWVIGLTAGSFVLTWLYRGSGSSILLVAVWHTAFNFTSATPAASGAVAAMTSTVVMVAAIAIAAADWRQSRAHFLTGTPSP
jgi:membrane protease YdiL (CAAX protease family)